MKFSKRFIFLLAVLAAPLANAADITINLLSVPFRFHPVFASPGNVQSTLQEFSAYDTSGNPTNANSVTTKSQNGGQSVPVYGLVNAIKTQIGIMTIAANGSLTYTSL